MLLINVDILPYRDAIMMKQLAVNEFFGVIVDVGWEQLT